jgi:flagellar assembly protein FliH
MTVIKRRLQSKGAAASAAPNGPQEGDATERLTASLVPALTPENHWDVAAFLAGELPDRRQADDDRRNAFRREADHAQLQSAERAAVQIRESAHAEGFQAGLDAASLALEQVSERLLALLQAQDSALQAMADQLAPLAVQIAERLLKTEVTCDDTLINAYVREVLQKVGRDVKELIIRVEPEAVTFLKQAFKAEPWGDGTVHITVLGDETVDAGSCTVETSGGLVDATFTTQLALLKKAMNIVDEVTSKEPIAAILITED